jgi:hypothetical protein
MMALRQRLPETISARLRRAVTEADLDPGADIPLIATYYTTVLYGLAQRAADGESRQTLLKVAEHAMDAWTGLAEVPATNPDQAGHYRPGDTRSVRLSSWQMPTTLDRSPAFSRRNSTRLATGGHWRSPLARLGESAPLR